MTENLMTPTLTDEADPRFGFAQVSAALVPLLEGAVEHLEGPTPCADYTVRDLMDHVVLVMRRVAAIGVGDGWASVTEEALDGEWAEHFRTAAGAIRLAWDDPAKLEQIFEVPWAEMPGAPLLLTYTAELAIHGWDLAMATGGDLGLANEPFLNGALDAVKYIPAEGRGSAEVPFDPVVDVGPEATLVEQMAAWTGRPVTA